MSSRNLLQTISEYNSHIDAAVVCLLREGERHVVNVALDGSGMRPGGDHALRAVVLECDQFWIQMF